MAGIDQRISNSGIKAPNDKLVANASGKSSTREEKWKKGASAAMAGKGLAPPPGFRGDKAGAAGAASNALGQSKYVMSYGISAQVDEVASSSGISEMPLRVCRIRLRCLSSKFLALAHFLLLFRPNCARRGLLLSDLSAEHTGRGRGAVLSRRMCRNGRTGTSASIL